MSKQNVKEVVLNADRTELLNYQLGLERFVEIFVLADTHSLVLEDGSIIRVDGNYKNIQGRSLRLYSGNMYWISNIPGEEDINFRVIPYCSIEGDYFLKPIHIGGSEFEHYRLPINYEKRDVKLIASDGNYGYFATGNVMRDVIICKLVGYDF